MKRLILAISAAALASVSQGGTAMASEFADGVIVISDNWCAPNNDGNCFKCNSGRLIDSARCTSSYCDNMNYQCMNPPFIGGEQTTMSGSVFIVNETNSSKNFGWTSDEQGEFSQNAVCPVGTAMVGMFSSNSYSDNVRARCQTVSRPSGWGGFTIIVSKSDGPISDEFPFNFTFSAGNWLSGASCTNSYCDNMFYWFTTIS